MFDEENRKEIGIFEVQYSQEKRSYPTSPSKSRKVFISTLLAIVLTALIGLNVKFVVFLISKNSSDDNSGTRRSLVISDGKSLYALDASSKTALRLRKSEKGVAAFDVHSSETILWNEMQSSTVQSISKSYGSVEGTEIWRTQAIATDEANNLLYIVDKSSGALSVYDPLEGIHGIVFSDLVGAHDLAVDPAVGYLFILQLCDSIIRCDMDGSSRRKIVQDPDVSAFAIDRQRQLVYYASKFRGIRAVDYNGQRGSSVIKFPEETISLAVFQTELFWTSLSNPNDTSLSELWSCQISTVFCHNATKHEITVKNPRTIKAPSAGQHFDNPCENNSDCEQLCLLASNNSYSCACHMGWYLDASSGTCQNAIVALTYVQRNYIRARYPSEAMDTFSDVIVPRSFSVEALDRKSSIDYTIGSDNFYISDDTAIYTLSQTSETIDGGQRKIFTAATDRYIRNIEFDLLNEYLYFVVETSIDDRWISVLSLVDAKPVSQTRIKPQMGVFLIGAVHSLLRSPDWDDVFGPALSTFSKTSAVPYFDLYEMVGTDLIGNRLYWIGNRSQTKIEYVEFDEVQVNRILDRGVLELPIVLQPTSLAVLLDWIFVGNSTGIWRFDKLDGGGAIRIAGNNDEHESLSHAKICVGFSVYSERFSANAQFETEIGV